MRGWPWRAGRLRRLVPPLAVLLLAGCGGPSGYVSLPGSPSRPEHPIYRIGAPYKIGGVWYTPHVDYHYDETGIASWYGGNFDGRYTSNGEVFDINGLTAAHRTLPLPSIVEVTNLRNGRMLQLRVNDRGPFANNRILDVSRRAAQLLGFETAGTTPVRVRILAEDSIRTAEAVIRASGQNPALLAEVAPGTPEPVVAARSSPPPYASRPVLAERPRSYPPRPPGTRRPAPVAVAARQPPSGPFSTTPRLIFVQAGAYARSASAMRAIAAIAPLGNVAIVTTSEGGSPVYRVQLGPVATGGEAELLRSRLVERGYAARIVVD